MSSGVTEIVNVSACGRAEDEVKGLKRFEGGIVDVLTNRDLNATNHPHKKEKHTNIASTLLVSSEFFNVEDNGAPPKAGGRVPGS